jgi:hypothetical protein
MSFPLTGSQISSLLGTPLLNTVNNWPLLESALVSQGISSDAVCIAALATVKVESPSFLPIHEIGSAVYFQKHYEGRLDLGNTHQGDGIVYAGRGFIQITGRKNYHTYGTRLNIDLETYPDRALDPNIAASILALYFKDHKIDVAAEAGDWVRVRQLVNGGKNALSPFLLAEQALEKALPPLASMEAQAHLGIVQTLRNRLHL